jgi:hypothetical protein
VFVQDLVKSSIKEEADQVVEKPPDQPLVATVPPPSATESSLTTLVVSPTTNADDWRVPFINFLPNQTGYADQTENERLMHRSKQYLLVDGVLMHKNAKEEVLMKCITREVGIQLLHEIHSGTCGNHAASQTLVDKAFRACFYWPSAVADTEKLVRRCDGCQFFAKCIHVLAHEI